MKSTSTAAFAAALAAAAVLAPGCRTIHGNNPGAEIPANPAAEQDLPPASVVPVAVDPAGAATAAEAPAPVLEASQVGTPGTYKQFVLSGEDESDRSYAVEAGGLRGQTGKHVSAPPPEREPEAKPAPAPAGSGVYIVQPGDILGRIAAKHGVTTRSLAEANGLADPSKIRVGQKLKIPARSATNHAKPAAAKAPAPKPAVKASTAKKTLPPKAGYTTHIVQSGEILGRIAKKYGTTISALKEVNGISDPTKLRAGQAIYVPTSGAAPAPAAPKPAAPVVAAPAPAPLPTVDVSEPELPPPPAVDGSYFAD